MEQAVKQQRDDIPKPDYSKYNKLFPGWMDIQKERRAIEKRFTTEIHAEKKQAVRNGDTEKLKALCEEEPTLKYKLMQISVQEKDAAHNALEVRSEEVMRCANETNELKNAAIADLMQDELDSQKRFAAKKARIAELEAAENNYRNEVANLSNESFAKHEGYLNTMNRLAGIVDANIIE